MDIFKISPHTLYLIPFFVSFGKKLKFHPVFPSCPFLDFFFFTKMKFTSKKLVLRVRNLSQNARNGHSGESNFQKFSNPLES